MTFGAPTWFYALALLPVFLALFFWNEKRRAELLCGLVAARLQPELTASVSARGRRTRFALLLAGMACVVAALAEPRLGYTFEPSHRKGRDVLIAIDVSKSMLANDVAPSRLERAKLAAQDLIGALPGDRVGLIAFAGTAFLQAPLTIDYSAVLASVRELDTDVIPRGGTDIAEAIRVAAEAFGKGESANRALVLFTDGEELEENAVQAARAHAGDFRIFTVGVGSKEGSLIPVEDARGGTEFVRDPQGQYVKSRLDEARLSEIAQAGGGFYTPLGSGPATVKTILEQGLGKMQEHEIDARQARRPIERYQWPLAAGLALLMASQLVRERRRASARVRVSSPVHAARPAAGAAILFMLLLTTASAWCRNSGVELYDQKNYKGALDTFTQQIKRNPDSHALHYDAGAAAYKAGDYDRALEAFSRATTTNDPAMRAKAEYNLANTLVQRGAKQSAKEPKLKEWQNALQHYDEALKVEPKDEDAKYNRELVRKMMEELEKQQPPEQQQQQQQKQDQKQNQQQKNDQQQQKNQQNSKQNQQDKQQQQNSQQQQQKSGGEKNDQQQDKQSQQDKNSGGSQQQQQKQDQSGKGSEQQQKEGGQEQNKPDEKSGGQQQQQPDQKQNGKSGGEKNNEENAGNPGQQKQQQPSEGGQQQNSGQQAGAEGAASPQPTPGDKKLTGEIQAQGQPGGENGESGEKANAAAARAEAAPEKPGEMSEAQARALIESLKGEDEHVSLQERKRSAPVYKDW